MLGIIILLLLLSTEIGFMIYRLSSKAYHGDKKDVLNILLFASLSILTLVGVLHWGFRWTMLLFILFVKAILCMWHLLLHKNRKNKTYKKKYVIMSTINNSFLFLFALLPAIIFPQFAPLDTSGTYDVETVSYTLTDPERTETFSDVQENRKVTVQFWYPREAEGKYPLLVFSHGSFGFRGSNLSTFEKLASNGYIVCSIDHSYHAFFTKQTDGKMITVNTDFINDAIAVTNGDYDELKSYQLTHEWLDLRIGDMSFVLDDILSKVDMESSDGVYHKIDKDKIGLFGHSLGGATAAELGRDRTDVDAVIVVDGTMLGEELAYEDGEPVLNMDQYPVPLLNLYNEEHYQDANQDAEHYANKTATANATDAREIVIKGSGHLNFTDLPMFSPMLADMLGTGEVDSRYCIDTMNKVILEYFDYYLKDSGELKLQSEY